ncbi:DUF805 domain-containing protein [Microvirga roseola]|uniref:DUF805 domain-containing protein n=1 Tax=Microvirga roseola TaxID=2883126 RepID=UPI001E650628|nr:DUF805 domain-containing protein [Microvirga roseola]
MKDGSIAPDIGQRQSLLSSTIALIIIGALASLLETGLARAFGAHVAFPFAVLFTLAQIFPSFAITAKRLQDRDLSAWWMLVGYASLPLGFLLLVYADFSLLEVTVIFILCRLATFGSFIWLFIQVGFLRGTVGPNRFGPDPLEPNLNPTSAQV